MCIAALPHNESERLAELYRQEILDTLPEQAWDDLALLAALICDTPIAAIGFTDQRRQWFKSIQGLAITEADRDVALCSHVVFNKEILIVEDATKDPRFAANGLVTGELGLRFYAGAPIFSDGNLPLGSLCIIDNKPRQITAEQAEALQALSRQVTQLLSLRRKQKELKVSQREFQNLAHMRQQILSNTSHEIRTPLNAILGYTQLLNQTDLNLKQEGYIKRLKNSSQHVLDMINSILDLAKIEAGEIVLEKKHFLLESILDTLRDVLTLSADRKGLELIFNIAPDFPSTLWGDPLRLEQVLLNLMGNAIKFTQKGSVCLKMTYDSDAPEKACYFEVSDTGIGMSEEQIQRVFEPYSQADISISRKFGGTGLGLTISKELVGLMGGHLQVKSSLDAGACFSFSVPMPVLPQSEHTYSHQVKNLKILVVEDNPDTLRFLESHLKHLGCEVVSFDNPQAVLQHASTLPSFSEAYDVLLIDWRMPGLSGLDLFNTLKPQFGIKRPYTLLMTAYGNEMAAQAELSKNIDRVLYKPLTLSTLYNQLLATVTSQQPLTPRPKKKLPQFKGHILVVEDNDVNQDIMRELLENMGLTLDIVDNGQEALRVVNLQSNYDIVLMDLQMPVMDGIEAARLIREFKNKRELPIIALTADVLDEAESRIQQVGMNALLSKPFHLEKLVSIFRYYLNEAKGVKEPAAVSLPDTPFAVDLVLFESQLLKMQAEINFDYPALYERVVGDLHVMIRLFQRFLAGHQHFIQDLKKIWAPTSEEYSRKLHTLKGIAGNLGFLDLEAAVKEVQKIEEENPLQTVSFKKMESIHAAVFAQCESAILASQIFSDSASTDYNADISDGFYEALLELSMTLSRYDVSAADQIKILISQSHGYQDELKTMESAIKRFDYPHARSLVQLLLKNF